MKVVALSDLHGACPSLIDRDAMSKADLILLAGDIFENDIIVNLWNFFADFHNEFPNIKIVMTPGNHDFSIMKAYLKEEKFANENYGTFFDGNEIRLSRQLIKEELGIDVLIDELLDWNGVKIYGAPYCAPLFGWAFTAPDDIRIKKWNAIPYNVDFLICHTPYFNTDEPCDIDVSLEKCNANNKQHFGCKYLYAAIKEKQPKYFFCGHIHSGNHNCQLVGNTKCYNVSYLDEEYCIRYHVNELIILNVGNNDGPKVFEKIDTDYYDFKK